MFDAKIRGYIDPPLNNLGKLLADRKVSANAITLIGFVIGLSAVPFIANQYYDIGLILILFNRLFDGIDGAVARQTSVTNVGGYLDIVLDFIFYSAVVFAFALAQPENAIYSSLLIFSFIGTGTSFLAFAIFAEKLDLSTEKQGEKSIYYLAGLTEGFETIAAFILMCLFPKSFWIIALVFAIACFISTVMRIFLSVKILSNR